MTGPGWQETVFDWYTLAGAGGLARALAGFTGGNLVISITDMPIKCPVAPLEFAFLADWYFQERGMRDKVTISYVTPLDAAFTKKACAKALAHLLEEKGIQLVTEFATGSIDGAAGKLMSFDQREVPFDMLAVVPVHAGAAFLRKTPGPRRCDAFVRTNQRTLQYDTSRTSSRSVTPPTCRRPRPDRSPTSRPRCSRRISSASWWASR